MDLFTFVLVLIIISLAVCSQQNWIIFGTFAVLLLTARSFKTIILLFVSFAIIFILGKSMIEYWPVIIIGLTLLAIFLGLQPEETKPEPYPPEPFGGLFGGGI
ncbi:MAG: hypothetical protein J7L14_01245 [Candidatus Diapherotrites archaeon]|nr:hypothetical protein [Candidatus Diapherotrites archaeon]